MLSCEMDRTISVVGAGRVGKTLARCLHRRGWRIEAIVAGSTAHARAAVRSIGTGRPLSRRTPDIFTARVVIFATPDAVLGDVAGELAQIVRRDLRGTVVLHTSGALDHRLFAPLARLGAATGSMHPMQTFTGRGTPNLKGIIFAIEGEPAARRVAQRIARELGGTPVVIDGSKKTAYHAAGAFVAGHGLALAEAATQILLKLGFTRGRALQALLPLMRQMLDNFEAIGPQRAWTGPISRGDYAVVAAHAKALKRYPREFERAYAALSTLAARVLAKDRARTAARVRRALAHK
jgi:predicted short-subunit dehydrogenase-like oxidoreductase (DUF2520 family)